MSYVHFNETRQASTLRLQFSSLHNCFYFVYELLYDNANVSLRFLGPILDCVTLNFPMQQENQSAQMFDLDVDDEFTDGTSDLAKI